MRNILWCIYWKCVQAAGVSASFCSMVGAEPGRWGLKPLPLHVDALFSETRKHNNMEGGVRGGGRGRGGFGLGVIHGHVSRSDYIKRSSPPSVFTWSSLSPRPSFTIRESQMPHLLRLISDEGKHFWTTLTWVLNSWLFFPHPKLLIGILAMWIPRASSRQVGGRLNSGGGKKGRCWKGRILQITVNFCSVGVSFVLLICLFAFLFSFFFPCAIFTAVTDLIPQEKTCLSLKCVLS